MKMRIAVPLMCWTVLLAQAAARAETPQQASQLDVPESKQTKLGLYVTAKQAYEKWQADPDNVKILDVRTPEEYVFVGHAEMARNVPLRFIAYRWNEEKKMLDMKRNGDFIAQVKQTLKPTDTILITCRSGGRSKMACDLLADAGFKTVYNIVDGFEGDAVKDPNSPDSGKRTKNGWKNSGAPWTYELNPKLVYQASE